MGVPFEYKFYPWKRSEYNLKYGSAFAGFPYFKTKERENTFDFSDEIVSSRIKFFFLKSKFKDEITWDKLEDLKEYNIGGALGNWYEPVFKAAGMKVQYSVTDELSFKKLNAHVVDLVPTDELVGWEIIKKLFPRKEFNFATVKKPLKEDMLRLMISKKYPGAAMLKEKFNVSLKHIKEKGIYSEILKKYHIAE